MKFRALFFGSLVVAGATFGQDTQRHSIPAMKGGVPLTATTDGGTCSGNVVFTDGGCLIQLRKVTEPDASGAPRTLNVISQPTPAACGQSVSLHTCTFACTCPAAPAPAPKKK